MTARLIDSASGLVVVVRALVATVVVVLLVIGRSGITLDPYSFFRECLRLLVGM